MFSSSQRLPFSWLCLCIALVGSAYCGLQLMPEAIEVSCVGSGCQLFQDVTLFGISLWWLGLGFFVFALLCCLRRYYGLLLFLTGAALIADIFLLVIMLLTSACIPCLGAALLFAMLFLATRRHIHQRQSNSPSCSKLFVLWAAFFVAALSSAGTEQMSPWFISGGPGDARRVYFSPSCPACRDAVATFAGNAAFVPVVERESDYAAIFAMDKAIRQGKNLLEALEISDNASEIPVSLESALFRMHLLRNKAEIFKLGFDRLPLLMINGMPESMRPVKPGGEEREQSSISHTSPRESQDPSSVLPPELSALNSCGEQDQEPCEP